MSAQDASPTTLPLRQLTDEESEDIDLLTQTLEDNVSAFTVSGVVPVEKVDPSQQRFFYIQDGQDESIRLPFTAETAKRLYEASIPAPHGRDGETVLDESYRLARELKTPDFGLSFSPLDGTGILSNIARKLDIDRPLEAKLYKANVYGPGGFFKAHRDTPRGENHIGTITLCLPSEFEGGQLVVRHNGREVSHDWSSIASSQISWAFLFSDCEHEVLSVTSGYRITLAFDVFTTPTQKDEINDTRVQMVRQRFLETINKPDFLPEGGVLGYALQHRYPIELSKKWDSTGRTLKGIDRIVMDAIREGNLEAQWSFAHHSDLEDYLAGTVYYEGHFRFVDRGTVQASITHDYSIEVLTSQDPHLMYGDYIEGSTAEALINAGAKLRKDVFWLNGLERYERAGTYISYGNEAEANWYYVNPCLFITISPASERLETEALVALAKSGKKRKA